MWMLGRGNCPSLTALTLKRGEYEIGEYGWDGWKKQEFIINFYGLFAGWILGMDFIGFVVLIIFEILISLKN